MRRETCEIDGKEDLEIRISECTACGKKVCPEHTKYVAVFIGASVNNRVRTRPYCVECKPKSRVKADRF